MNMRERIAALTGSSIVRDVLKLVSGTLGGRLIALAALPLVTRLYSPQDFALLAVYLSLLNLCSVGACLRFDAAIPVAKSDEDAAQLLVLSLLIAFVLASTGLIVVTAAPKTVADLVGQPALAPWLWLVPVGVLMAASYSALRGWATRARRFGSIAMTRITQSATGVATMLALGWAGIAPFGLLFGNLLNASAGGLRLGLDVARKDRPVLKQVAPAGLLAALRNYQRYAIYSTPDAIANLAGSQAPMLIIAAHAGAEAGFLLLAQQIMTAPMTLLGSSIAQVYVSRAPEQLQKGQLAEFTLRILRRLIQAGIGPLVLAGLAAPLLLPPIFGVQWSRAGEIISWMVPWNVLQFIGSPISMVMYVVDRQGAMLALTLFGGALRIGSVLVAGGIGPDALVPAFIGSSALFYGICLLVFCRAAGIGLGHGGQKLMIYLVLPLAAYGIIMAVSSGWFRA